MNISLGRGLLVAPMLMLGACVATTDQAVSKSDLSVKSGKHIQRGQATWYGPGFHGRKTASGERFNTHAMTAAHRSLPFGSKVRVVNEKTGHSVVVRINDRGPFTRGKIIDLARAPAQVLGISGVGQVALYAAEE
jgi:rare lipoprotein A